MSPYLFQTVTTSSLLNPSHMRNSATRMHGSTCSGANLNSATNIPVPEFPGTANVLPLATCTAIHHSLILYCTGGTKLQFRKLDISVMFPPLLSLTR